MLQKSLLVATSSTTLVLRSESQTSATKFVKLHNACDAGNNKKSREKINSVMTGFEFIYQEYYNLRLSITTLGLHPCVVIESLRL